MTKTMEKIKEFRLNSLKIHRQMKEMNKTKTSIKVHLGFCGAAVGAEEILKHMKDMVNKLELQNHINLEVAGCMGLCSHEPIIQVTKPGMRTAVYCSVTKEMAEAIFNQHVLNGVIIQPWLLSTSMGRR